MTAFSRIGLRHLAAHRLRTLFTALGISLGVSAMIAIPAIHETATRSYERMVERIAGSAVLQITNGEVGVPEELVDEVKGAPGVAAVSASVQGFVPLAGHLGERLFVLGVDLLADQGLREYDIHSEEGAIEDPLVFLAQADSVALTAKLLDETGLQIGDRITLVAPQGPVSVTIRGALGLERGPATLFGGRLALMDIFAAQRLLDLAPRVSQIDVALSPGAGIEAVTETLRVIVGGRGVVERPATRGEALDRLLGSMRYGLTTAAFFTVLVGLYLVFNTMMIAVAERQKEIGILRALGMRRSEVLRLVASESLALGAVGCALGVPLGLLLARGMSNAFLSSVSMLYLPVGVAELVLRPGQVVLAVVVGLLATLIAAVIPAREAVRVHPLETLRPSSTAAREPARARRTFIAGLVVTSGATAVWVGRHLLPVDDISLGSVASLGWLVGVSLIVPAIVRAFARHSEPVLGAALGPIGVLASRSLTSHLGRLSITSSAFVVSLAAAIATASIVSSIQATFVRWFDVAFSSIDLVVTSGESALSRSTPPLPGGVADEIAAISGVAHIDRVRLTKISYGGSLVTLGSRDAELIRRGIRRIQILEGDPASALDAVARGEAATVNEAFCQKFQRCLGDDLLLPTPGGELRLPIAAVIFDVDDVGTVWIDRKLYQRWWRDDSANYIEPILEVGIDRERVIAEIRRRFGDRHNLFILTAEEFRGEGRRLIGQTAALSYPLIAIAILIALLGIVNSLVASVLDRVREIGLLRVAGATRRQIMASVVVECGAIGAFGGILAALFGSALGYYQVDLVARVLFALTVFYSHPTTETIVSVLASIVLAALAGIIPGRVAARLRVREALEYE